jgi:hypothetical protein
MNKDLYLITWCGERQEDHIPKGIYDFEHINKFAEIVCFYDQTDEKYVRLTEEQLKEWDDNTWYDLQLFDCGKEYVDEFFENQNKDGSFDDCLEGVSIIRFTINEEMPGT